MKAEKGDLIRIIDKHPQVETFEIGGIYEVVGYSDKGTDNEQVVIFGIGGREGYVDHNEYVIHRKAGEEDSANVRVGSEFLTEIKSELIDAQSTQADRIRTASTELADLLVRKNHDYGDSFSQQYGKYGLMSALIRMDDKMRRLETLQGGQQAEVAESIGDTLLDLSGYALLAYVETQRK